MGLSIIATIVFALTFWIKEIAAIGLMILIIGGIVVLYRHKNERKWALYLALQTGLRMIAVRPNSPAESNT